MKPKDLKALFSWEERKPYLDGPLFYVPNFFEKHDKALFPGWEDPQIFAAKQPIYIEYCSGNGDWILKKAMENPHLNWVAVEYQFERVRKIWAKIKNFNLSNLFIISGEAMTFTKNYISDASVEKVFVNFPDPWPKKRHHKHRLMQTSFIEELYRILLPNGGITFVTDDSDYLQWTLDLLLKNLRFQSLHPEPYYATNLFNYGSSYFESLWKEKGKTLHYVEFIKKPSN